MTRMAAAIAIAPRREKRSAVKPMARAPKKPPVWNIPFVAPKIAFALALIEESRSK